MMTLSKPKTRQTGLNEVQLVDRLAATGMARYAAEYILLATAELGHYEFASGLLEVWMHEPGVYSLIMTEQPERRVITEWEFEETAPGSGTFELHRCSIHQVRWHGHWYSDSDIKPHYLLCETVGTLTRQEVAALVAKGAQALVDAWPAQQEGLHAPPF
jgi:hypothetical protein